MVFELNGKFEFKMFSNSNSDSFLILNALLLSLSNQMPHVLKVRIADD